MNREVSFGRWMRKQRKALDLTQDKLAHKVGCALVTIRKIEADERRPSTQLARLLAQHLEIKQEDYPAFLRLARMATPANRPALPVWSSSGRQRTNLPVPLTSLIGRDEDVAAVSALIVHQETRLLSLIGPPGVGKTRLALQVATKLLDGFADGAFFVALAPVRDPDLVAVTIAQTLGLVEIGSEPLNVRLAHALEDKQLLLLLDNFEQVVAAAPLVAELLAACPRLKVLVTSRAALRVRGEQLFNVQPLALPDLAALHAIGPIARYPSVALFVERARSAKPTFRLSAGNAAAVAAICIQIDGLPLAIELVAAYANLFSPQTLLAQLSSRLKLSTTSARDLPDRQQTLWTAFDWSYDLLSAGERKLFERLSVFVGGCTLAAAATLCSALGDLEIDVLDGMLSLLDKSLLRQEGEPDDEPRFTMLETIREYGRERLAASGVAEAVRRRHAQLFLELAEAAEPFLRGPQQDEWLARLEVEHGNLAAALEWSWTEAGDIEVGVRLVGALWWFWHRRGHMNEGRHWSEGTLERTGMVENMSVRANALQGAGVLAWLQGDYAMARDHLEQSMRLWQELENDRGVAYALTYLGMMTLYQDKDEETRSLHEKGLAIFREADDQWGLALTLRNLGAVALFQGDFGRAHSLYEKSLAIFREVGDPWGLVVVLNDLGEVARSQGDYRRAQTFYEDSLAILPKVEDRWLTAMTFHNLAYVAQYQGDCERATELIEESLKIWRDLGNKRGIAICLVALAGVSVTLKQLKRAVRLFGAADALFDTIGARMDPPDYAEYKRDLDAARSQLDEAAFVVLWTEGKEMTLDQVIART